LQSSYVGELGDVDSKEMLSSFMVATGPRESAGDAPALRVSLLRQPGGDVALIVGAADDASDRVGDWVPIDPARGQSMLAGLRCRASLNGRDIEALGLTLCRLSLVAHMAPYIATLEVERLVVLEEGKGCIVVAAKSRFGPV
jgi:hypothetical protein